MQMCSFVCKNLVLRGHLYSHKLTQSACVNACQCCQYAIPCLHIHVHIYTALLLELSLCICMLMSDSNHTVRSASVWELKHFTIGIDYLPLIMICVVISFLQFSVTVSHQEWCTLVCGTWELNWMSPYWFSAAYWCPQPHMPISTL